MQLGPYLLQAPLEPTAAGATFRAVGPDGAPAEVRFLNRVKADANAWELLAKRLRLVGMLEHSAHLRPIASDLEHDPPYLVMPVSEPVRSAVPAAQLGPLAGLLGAAHRLGLTLGARGRPVLRRSGNRIALDLTDTAGVPTGSDLGDPLADVARLADLLEPLVPVAGRPADWAQKLAKMRSDPSERPTAHDVAAWFRAADLGETSESEVGDHTGLAETHTPEAKAPAVGDRLGRFLLKAVLGEGGMGVVYRAEDPADGTTVAVKVLRTTNAASDKARRRFVREGRVLAALDTPYVTRLIDANTDGDRCFLALEFIPGPSLGARLKKAGKFDEATALGFISDAARGLAAAHALGMIHRDIKPDNLLVAVGPEDSLQVKVTDFGLARAVLPTESLEVTRPGAAIGTPLYMAPEQFGSGTVDARADVYGLGATLFHMIAGRPPFEADGMAMLAKAVASDEPPALDRLVPSCSGATAALVAKCLSKDPARRPIDAGAMLRDIERIRGGEPTDVAMHPRLPTGAGKATEFTFTWELKAPPAKLWPYVSNTERLNRAIGLPPVRYETRRDPDLGTRRYATAKVAGMRMEWEEHPFEWVEGRRLGVLREFSRGPFAWFASVVELIPRGTGTLLKHTVRAEPRGLVGRFAAWLELSKKAPRSLEKVYRRIDALVATKADAPTADAFEEPTRLNQARQQRVRAGVNRLVASGSTPESAELLGLYLANAPDQEAARIRPLALAHRFGLDETGVTDACLRAVGAGLLQLQWDVICPLCKIPSGRKDTLRELKEHEHCQACAADFQVDFAAAVELVFKVHPDVRPVEVGVYCAGGPSHSPHVVAQTRVAPGENIELELDLSEGAYRIRSPQLAWAIDLRIAPGASGRRWEIDLAKASKEKPTLAPGGQVLALRNGRATEIVVRVERMAARDDALTAARATALPAFRDLFPGELLTPGQLTPAATVTLLFVQLADGERIYDRLGEAPAFQLLQATFRALETKIKSDGGAVVKTVGEGLVAAFAEVTTAVKSVLGLTAALSTDPVAKDARLKAGLHRGLAMVATFNDRLDYFGQTVRLTNRLLIAAEPGEACLSVAAAGDPEVTALIRDHHREVKLTEVAGERGPVLAYRVALNETGKS